MAALGQGLPTSEARIATYLTPECKAALESVIPYDGSWDDAPAGLKDKVSEAFQALIAYPLAIPEENTLLGARPRYMGAIPQAHLDIFREYENPNQSIFNYVLNQIDTLKYAPTGDNLQNAQYVPAASLGGWREMTVFDAFWDKDGVLGTFVDPFTRAGTLVHEARHGDGILHVPCAAATQREGFTCDADLTGPYGFEVSYLHFLLQGSGRCEGAGCKPLLPNTSLALIAREMTKVLQQCVVKLEPEIASVAFEREPRNTTAHWIKAREGL